MAFTTKAEAAKYTQEHVVMLQVIVDGIVMATIPGTPKINKSGSVGFNGNGKAALPNGDRLQVGANLTVIGSGALPAS